MAPLVRLFFLAPILFMISFTVSPPPGTLIHGKLCPCPEKPNCVSSENGVPEENQVAPLPFTGDPKMAWQQLQEIINEMIHLRSGARTGFTDLGVNRKRV